VRLDDALELHEPAPMSKWHIGSESEGIEGTEDWQASSWGMDGDLSTWSGPAVAEMAFAARAAELDVMAAGGRASTAAVRELLALQASDWAFMISRGLAAPYGRERFAGHSQALRAALRTNGEADMGRLRHLAVHADRDPLLGPL